MDKGGKADAARQRVGRRIEGYKAHLMRDKGCQLRTYSRNDTIKKRRSERRESRRNETEKRHTKQK